MFATFDTGGTGRLDRKQIGALMEAADMNVTAERTDFLFELMDKNSKHLVVIHVSKKSMDSD